MRIFDHAENKLVYSYGVFRSDPLHGIVCHGVGCSTDEECRIATSCTAVLLLWGGSSISVLALKFIHDPTPKVYIRILVPETILDDRILNGCCYHGSADESVDDSISPDFFLVNAHNELLSLKLAVDPNGGPLHKTQVVASGPRSMLYSAHIITTATSRALIAAGTFFGEIVVWSFLYDTSVNSPPSIHHIFRGHEGSIFGVQISEESNGCVERVMASCSDDRTIKIWDISDTTNRLKLEERRPNSESGFGSDDFKADSVKSLATVMAHSSRIWGVRFLRYENNSWGLLSFGEDATAQTWLLCPIPVQGALIPPVNHQRFELRRQTIYRYHSGKSIWAATIHLESTDRCLVSTGGSDGRITSYHLKIEDGNFRSAAVSHQCTVEESYALVAAKSPAPNGSIAHTMEDLSNVSAGLIFDTLEGHWQLSRTILDGHSSNRAGSFEGTATVTLQKPSDDSFDGESLYSEEGEFTTIQGLKLKANRQYVWRYRKRTNAITVWFVKTDGSLAVDYFFHALDLRDIATQSLERSGNNTDFKVLASGHHVCGEDDYQVEYTFHMRSTSVAQWAAEFTVRGPKKGYIATSIYTREDDFRSSESQKTRAGPVAGEVNHPSVSNGQRNLGAGAAVEVTNHSSLANGWEKDPIVHQRDAFKTYAWLSETEFLASTKYGIVFIGTVNDQSLRPTVSWENISCQISLRPSCIATSVCSMGIVLLTGSEGTIYIYQHSNRKLACIHKLEGKIVFLRAQALQTDWVNHSRNDPSTFKDTMDSEVGQILSLEDNSTEIPQIVVVARCLESSKIHAIMLQYSGEWMANIIKELPLESFVVTSSCFVKVSVQLIMLGSRRGQLAVHDLSESSWHSRRDSTFKLHEDQITSITVIASEHLGSEGDQIVFATTGRDGTYKIHSLTVDRIGQSNDDRIFQLSTVNDCKLPFGPYIEGAYFDAIQKDLFLWGFRSTQFVVWNDSQKAEVLSVECGNAHRNWDYMPHENGKGGGSFVFTKASVCCVYSQKEASHRVLHYGSHGREIKALALSPSSQAVDDLRSTFLATGAEDTAIRVFSHRPANETPRVQCLRILADHTTGIQQLCWSKDGQRLFSAAGCEEFFVWRTTSIPSIGLGVVLEARCPTVTESSDLRIMDFEVVAKPVAPGTSIDGEAKTYFVIMAYSDSSIRVFCYSSWLQDKFELLFTGSHNRHCLTQVKKLRPFLKHDLEICTAGTNGVLTLLQVDIRKLPEHSTPIPLQSLQWYTPLKIHQNSIQSLDVARISSTEGFILTGGDDGDMWLTYMRFPNADSHGSPPSHIEAGITPAHATAVTAVAYLATTTRQEKGIILLASVGTDQRLKVWEIAIAKGAGVEGVECNLRSDVHTSVADASSLGHCWDEYGQLWLYVAGVGMEIWQVTIGDV